MMAKKPNRAISEQYQGTPIPPQNIKRKKITTHLADRKKNRSLKNSPTTKPFPAEQTEEVLRQSEERYRTIIENIQDGYFENDLAGNLTFVNDALCRNLGYSREELIGMNYRQYTDEKTAMELFRYYDRLYRTGEPINLLEIERIRKDGTKSFAEISTSLIRDSEGKPIGLRGISRDITERKQAEEALQESEERYRALYDRSHDCVFVLDFEGKFIDANQAALTLLGYENTDIPSLNIASVLDERDLSKGLQDLNEMIQTGFQKEISIYRLRRKDGGIVYVETQGSVIYRDGKPHSIQGIARDVTEQKRAEEALQKSEERYRNILESIQEGYFETDLDGNYTFVNDANCRFLGYTKQELVGMNYRQHSDEKIAKELREHYTRLYLTGKPIEGLDVESIRKDGTKTIYETSVSLIRDPEGKPIGFRGVSRDITERKRVEEQLLNAAQQWRTTFDGISDIVCLLDREGRILKCNKAMTDLLGKPFSEIINRTHLEIVHGAPMPIEESPVERLWKTHHRETDILLINDRWFSIAVDPLLDEAGGLVGAVYIMSDITERKRTEEALRRSEEKYRTIIENMQEAFYELDLAGHFTFVNDALCKHLGYTKEELMGTRARQYQDETTTKKMHQIFTELYRTGKPVRALESEYVRKDGTKGAYELSASLIRDAHGKPIGFRGVSRNITERKQAEEALRGSEERYRTILESIEEAYFEDDLAGNFTFANDVLCRLLGYARDELIGMNYVQYTDEENATKLRELYSELYKTGKPVKAFDLEATKKDGTKAIYETSVSLMRDAEGKPIGFRGVSRDVTERKKMEAALREREDRYRTLLETMEEGYYQVDLAGDLTFFNDSFRKMHGFSIEKMLGMNNREYMAEETARRVYKIFNEVYKTGQPVRLVEWEIIRGDGKKAVMEASVYLIKNAQGERIGFRGIERDITERKRTEELLHQSEEKFRNILENIQDSYFEVDLAGNLTFMNDVTCRHLGYTKEELIGMNNRQFTDEKMAEELYQIFNRIYRTGLPGKPFEAEYIRKDGTKLIAEMWPSLIRDFGGKPIGFRSISRDITERKQAEEALRHSEERYRTIIESLQDGYFENDLAGNFTFANDVIGRHLGYTKEELIGLNYRQYTDEENREKLLQQYSELYRTGVPIKILEVGYLRKDGGKVFAEISTSLIKNSEGKPIGFRGISRDTTGRKQAEEEKLSLQEQLRQSQKMEAIGQLAGGVAHDFNNLLTVIKGYSQLSLLDLKENDPLRGNIQEIEKATQRATDLTRQLLAFSRRQILDSKVVDLNALLKDLEKMLRRIIGEDIELVALLSEDLGRVKIDPSQIEQVIFNLAVNARDAMPSGGKLTIETANVELDEVYAHAHVGVIPGRYVNLSVSDTGVGMSQEVKERVFEPFFTTKGKGKGTGLGLSMVYGIVKQSNGNIWVYSEPGHGTTFKINLPRIEEELDALRQRDETDFIPRGSETVLLVEDDELVRDLANRLLKQQGYKVLVAVNGEEALRVAREHDGQKIHLLLTDIVMPQMGGKELADKLKILRPDVKVLYTSGYAGDAIVHHGVLDPGTHFLQKPFSLKTLSHKVRELLDDKSR
jgi:two-component system, cell cycle sensor histidine kinase and response regulator CckA